MRMKKIFLVLAAALCVATVSAQSKFESQVKQAAQTIASQKWSVGLRLGSGAQVDAECFYAGDKYVEARLGLGWIGGFGADCSVLHNWNCCNWDWTPQAGKWFLDAGVGATIGGAKHVMWVGVAGQVKFGIKFNKVPIRLAVDVTPGFGPVFGLPYRETVETPELDASGVPTGNTVKTTVKYGGSAGFYANGILNLGLSATYCF